MNENKNTQYIALLRSINVGGHNKIKMVELRELLASLDLENVQTYLQSGNALFESHRTDTNSLEDEISSAIENSHGFRPKILLLTLEEIKQAAQANPFPEAVADPKTLHLGFLSSEPENPDFDKLENLKKESERFELKGNVFYLHAPDGVGRSKLAAGSEKALGKSMTDRNWRTIQKLIELAHAGQG